MHLPAAGAARRLQAAGPTREPGIAFAQQCTGSGPVASLLVVFSRLPNLQVMCNFAQLPMHSAAGHSPTTACSYSGRACPALCEGRPLPTSCCAGNIRQLPGRMPAWPMQSGPWPLMAVKALAVSLRPNGDLKQCMVLQGSHSRHHHLPHWETRRRQGALVGLVCRATRGHHQGHQSSSN